MAVRCFFSGVEGAQHFEAAVKSGARNLLMSYLYIEKKGDLNIVRDRKRKNPNLRYLIDSGAHTFQMQWANPPYNKWKISDYEDYLKRYVKWARANKDWVDAVVELDIDIVINGILFGHGSTSDVGSTKVKEWQERYFYPLEKEGIQVIYVWHKERKLEGFEEMCKKHSYVGLPGELSSEPDFNKYITIARRYTSRIHGFAATKQADFRDWPWFSIDSITWKTSEIYGTLIDWDSHKQKLTFEDNKQERGKFRQKFIDLGFDAEAIIKDTNYKEVTRYALWSMRSMEDFYEKKFLHRTFYYEMRLPHPDFVKSRMTNAAVNLYWAKVKPSDRFKNHSSEKDVSVLRLYLLALASVQSREESYLKPSTKGFEFLKTYFPAFIDDSGISNLDSLQKELANLLSPRNEPALLRTDRGHYVSLNNPPKKREEVELTLEELEHDVLSAPFNLSDFE